MTECCGFGKCRNGPGCVQRGYHAPVRPDVRYPLKDSPSGWLLIAAISLLIIGPATVITKPFGALAPWIFLAIIIGFPAWMVAQGTEPYESWFIEGKEGRE